MVEKEIFGVGGSLRYRLGTNILGSLVTDPAAGIRVDKKMFHALKA